MSKSDFKEFQQAYETMLLPENHERFDELAARAHFNLYHHDLWHGTGRLFAELIVRECCEMMIELEAQYPANLTVREIKQHFNIKD